jgi:hypothetical protein
MRDLLRVILCIGRLGLELDVRFHLGRSLSESKNEGSGRSSFSSGLSFWMVLSAEIMILSCT